MERFPKPLHDRFPVMVSREPSMPSFRARLFNTVLRHSIGKRFRRAGLSVAKLRKLEGILARSQSPPPGTRISSVDASDIAGEWVDGPGARTEACVLYLHGGAFVMGSPATHRELAARISTAGAARVLSLDYRLAPEFPFPAALDDARSAYHRLLGRGYPSTALVVGGDSSGGGLAIQLLLALRDEGAPMPCAAFFMSPVTDWLEFSGESFRTRAALDPLVTPTQTRYTASLYAGGPKGDNPLLCPTTMSLAGLPPLWIHVGDHEVLLSDAERLARKAADDGVEVEFRIWPGMWHVFQATARWIPEARRSLEDLSEFLRKRLKVPDRPRVPS